MNDRKLRIFHTADIHLDTPFSRLDLRKGEARRNDLRATFTAMMLYVRRMEVDIALLAGDLFDDGSATKDTVELMIREFEGAKRCKFIIAPGNHDPISAGSVYASKRFPDNVFIFRESKLSKFEFADLGCDVYGWAFTSPALTENPLTGAELEQNGRTKLLCAHCDTTSPISRYCPVSEGDIVRAGFDYAALGHIHKKGEIKRVDNTVYGYSGAPEGRSFDECGVLGAYITDIGYNGEFETSFVPFSRRRYEIAECDLTGSLTREDAEEKVNALIAANKYGTDTVLRLVLTGSVAPDVRFDGFPTVAAKLFELEIKDKTSPTFDGERLERDITIRGALYRTLLPELNSADEETRRTAADALRYGLAVLDGSLPGEF
ncbi:MAG: DNA repair exonuclease [Clostridia bacterium]|nr:DNA repair exonuclease [Clostridia bacterium]MBR0327725.1 DNA repair exonuclease [Clostridia bacterium]